MAEDLKQIELLKSTAESATAKAEQAAVAMEELQTQLSENNSQIQTLKRSLSDTESQLKQASSELDARAQEIQNARAQVAARQSEVAQLTEQLIERSEALAAVDRENKEVRDKQRKLITEHLSDLATIDQLRGQLISAKQSQQAAEAIVEDARRQLADAQAEV